jgi:RND family efflux transporter MFP subunit
VLGVWLCALTPARADVPGYAEPYKTITVSAGEAGIISEVMVEEGAQVKKGQVLAKLDTAQLEAELDIAKATTGLQETKLQRLEELAKTGRSSPDELERGRTDLKIRKAEVRKIEAAIESRTMRSPVDGVVTEVKRDPSEAVSVANAHVLTVVQIDRLLVNLFMPPARAATLKSGATVPLILDGKPVTGVIEFISPVTDAASGTVRVKFVLENKDGHLRSGGEARLAEP